MTFRLGVLADDFTGAGDAGLALAARGYVVEISGPDARGRWAAPGADTDAWILTTESRSLPPAAAARRVCAAVRALRRWGADRIYKKIDSTLRGPVAAEFAAFAVALRARGRIAFVPAFPDAGRVTRGGRHYVEGRPLHRTAFARDPRHPRRTSELDGILGSEAARAWVPDVPDNIALARVARRCRAGGDLCGEAAVGSAGFLSRWAERRGRRRADGARAPAATGPVLVVAGSAHPRTRRQLRRLAAAGRAVVVLAAPRRREGPGKILNNITRRAAARARRDGLRRWVLTGGETAWALCRRMRRRNWRLAGRVDRGVPLLRSLSGDVWAVVKPGGFGDEAVLVRAVERLGGR